MAKTAVAVIADERKQRLTELLRGKRKEILDAARRTLSRQRQERGEPDGSVFNCTHMLDEDIELTLLETDAEQLAEIEEALHRLDIGAYGICLDCGDEIAERRLEALPSATLCKDCKEVRESLSRQKSVGRFAES